MLATAACANTMHPVPPFSIQEQISGISVFMSVYLCVHPYNGPLTASLWLLSILREHGVPVSPAWGFTAFQNTWVSDPSKL